MTRAKLTTLAEGVVMAVPSPRVRVIWHRNQGHEHTLGFESAEAASTCYQWLLSKVGKYNRQANAGVNKPRKAERVGAASSRLSGIVPTPVSWPR